MQYLSVALMGTAAAFAASNQINPGSRTFEVMLPMRDGVKLQTRVVLPRETSCNISIFSVHILKIISWNSVKFSVRI